MVVIAEEDEAYGSANPLAMALTPLRPTSQLRETEIMNAPSDNATIRVLSLPELLYIIFGFLSHDELICTIRVNSRWFAESVRYLWSGQAQWLQDPDFGEWNSSGECSPTLLDVLAVGGSPRFDIYRKHVRTAWVYPFILEDRRCRPLLELPMDGQLTPGLRTLVFKFSAHELILVAMQTLIGPSLQSLTFITERYETYTPEIRYTVRCLLPIALRGLLHLLHNAAKKLSYLKLDLYAQGSILPKNWSTLLLSFAHLSELGCSSIELSNQNLVDFSKLARLKRLDLAYCRIPSDDISFDTVPAPFQALKDLDIGGHIRMAVFEILQRTHQLTDLNIEFEFRHTEWTGELRRVLKYLPCLTTLKMAYNFYGPNEDDDGTSGDTTDLRFSGISLVRLTENCPNLENFRVGFEYSDRFGDSGLELLDEHVRGLLQYLPKLTELKIYGTVHAITGVTQESLPYIAQHPSLRICNLPMIIDMEETLKMSPIEAWCPLLKVFGFIHADVDMRPRDADPLIPLCQKVNIEEWFRHHFPEADLDGLVVFSNEFVPTRYLIFEDKTLPESESESDTSSEIA